MSTMRETLKTPPEMAQSLTRKCEKGGREEDTSTCCCFFFVCLAKLGLGSGPVGRLGRAPSSVCTYTYNNYMLCWWWARHSHVTSHTHTYRKGREVIDEEDPGEDRGAVVVRVGVPLQPRGPFPVQGLEALRHREPVRADGLACVVIGGRGNRSAVVSF